MDCLGEVVMPPMAAEQRRLWDVILALSQRLEPTQGSLVGGQNVNARRNVPIVDGAITRCPNTPDVAPARSMFV